MPSVSRSSSDDGALTVVPASTASDSDVQPRRAAQVRTSNRPASSPTTTVGPSVAYRAHPSPRRSLRLLCGPDGLVERLRDVFNVVRVKTCHGDAAVLGHVDVRVLAQLQDLLLCQAGEAEHADLVGDVVPGTGGTELLELAAQCLAHLDDAARHGSQVLFPLCEELWCVQDEGGDTRTICRGVGDLGTLENGELRGHTSGGGCTI